MLTVSSFKMPTNGLQEASLFHGHVFSNSLRMTVLLQATVHFSVFLFFLSPLFLLSFFQYFSVSILYKL